MKKEIKKILIMTYAKVGDSFILVPAINFLKEYYKNASIDIFSEKRKNTSYNIKYALQDTKLIRKFYLYYVDNNIIQRKIEKLLLLQHLKKEKYDIVYVLLPPYRPATPELFLKFYKMIKIIKPKYFYIPNFIEWKKDWYNNRYLPMKPSIKYIFDFVIDSVQEDRDIRNYLFYYKDNLVKVEKKEKKYVIVTLKTDMKTKNYDLEKMEKFLVYLEKKYNINFAFVGTSKEKDIIESFSKKFPNSRRLIDKSFGYLYKFFIQNSKFYLGLDTGIMHLANLAKLPIFAIFSSRDVPGSWYPYGVPFEIVRNQVECEGCLKVNECPFNVKCMEIEVKEVINKLTIFLKRLGYE